MLAAAGADQEDRGDGGDGTADQEDRGDGGDRRTEVRFLYGSSGPFLLAGRDGFVSDVVVQQADVVPGFGEIAIAEFSFSVSVQQMSSIKVAVVRLGPGRRNADPSVWDQVLESISRKSVRFVAGQFADVLDQFLVATRAAVQVRACATVQLIETGESFEATGMFVLGPVGQVIPKIAGGRGCGHTVFRGDGDVALEAQVLMDHTADVLGQRSHSGGEREDRSRGWPTIQHTKEKEPKHVANHTTKIGIYFGSNASRRTRGKAHEREDKRQDRADKAFQRTGRQPHWRW